MLEPAILHKDSLNRLFALYSLKDEYKFYTCGENVQLIANIHDTNWEGHQFVSVDNGQKILGFMGATVDRNGRFVKNLSLMAFEKGKMTFIRDFQRFIWRLISYHNYHKIRWSVIVGSPHEKTYDRLCKTYGGRIVGVFENENRLEDGQLYNEKHYEIMSSNLINNALPVIVRMHDKGVKVPEYSGVT